MHRDLHHRHYVAAPMIALLMGVLFVLNGVAATFASDTGVENNGWIIATDKDVSATIPPAGSMLVEHAGMAKVNSQGTVELRKGTLHVHAHSLLRIVTPLGDVVSGGDSFVVMLSDDALSVIDISGCVFVATAGQLHPVFAGHQLRISNSGDIRDTEVPDEWFHDEESRLSALESSASPTISSSTHSVDTTRARLQDLLSGADSISDADVEEMFSIARTIDPQYGMFLVSFQLLREHARVPESSSERVGSTFFDAAAAVSIDGLSFVPSFILTQNVPPLEDVPSLWSQAAKRLCLHDPNRVFMLLTTVIKDIPAYYENLGYPKQARHWRDAMTSTSDLLSPLLPSDQQETLRIVVDAAVHPSPSPAFIPTQEAGTITEKTLERRLTDPELLAAAKSLLLQKKILQGLGTAVSVLSDEPDAVRVEGVFLTEEGRDVPYALTLDFQKNVVRSVVRDGRKLPNAVPFAAFFH